MLARTHEGRLEQEQKERTHVARIVMRVMAVSGQACRYKRNVGAGAAAARDLNRKRQRGIESGED